jgi:hypothetical protein
MPLQSRDHEWQPQWDLTPADSPIGIGTSAARLQRDVTRSARTGSLGYSGQSSTHRNDASLARNVVPILDAIQANCEAEKEFCRGHYAYTAASRCVFATSFLANLRTCRMHASRYTAAPANFRNWSRCRCWRRFGRVGGDELPRSEYHAGAVPGQRQRLIASDSR